MSENRSFRSSSILNKQVNGVVGGFVTWSFKMVIIIFVGSLLIATCMNDCSLDKHTIKDTKKNAKVGFEAWSTGAEKFSEALNKIAKRIDD